VSNRWFRFVIALLALAAAAAAGYRILQQERQLVGDMAAARSAAFAAERSIANVSEFKSALHAYIAQGQGRGFWTGRAAMLIDALRAAILEVDAAAVAAGVAKTEGLDLTDRLSAAEQRARDHLREDQQLLAGEVIFTDARDLTDRLRLQIARARDQIAEAADTRHNAIRREQAMLAVAAAGIMALALLLLVPPGRGPETIKIVETPITPAAAKAPPVAPVSVAAPPRVTPTALDDVARLCTDLAKIGSSAELSPLLDRAAAILGASGIIVWMSSPDGRELYPAASSGYDARLFTRIGSIARDASNLTAAAFREGAARTSAAMGPAAAALAMPLIAPTGAVGVLSAELRDVMEVDSDRMAMATIVAAQLAALLGSMSVADAAPAQKAQA
jgi:hypothetical protein